MIQLTNLTKKYILGEDVWEMKNINLQISSGEFVVITGPSGSGKSTLLHLLGALDFAEAGELKIGTQDLNKLPDKEIARYRNQKIGFVFQNFYLYPDIDLVENVALPLMLAGQAYAKRNILAQKALKLVGLGGLEKHNVNQISGGQRQRVAIARAIVNNPEIILADEPTGNLDPETGKKILELLQELQKNKNLTLVIVSHNEYIIKQAKRVITLNDGQIVPDSLTKNS